MKRKIAVIANNDAGLYNFRKELIEKLRQQDAEIHIIMPYGERVEDFKKMGCFFHDTPLERRGKNPFQDLKLLKKYSTILQQIKPDCVLTYTIKPNIYGGYIAGKKKIPYICNITGLGSALENPGILQKLTLGMYRKALRNVNCVFFQNQENYEFFQKNQVTSRKKKVIPGSGVNLTRFKMQEYPDDTIIRFLFISRVMREKGIEEYLEVARRMKAKYENVEFGILGMCEEQYEAKLEELQKQGIVRYYGQQPDIIPFLEKSHCTIHPSFYPEGMSNVCLESAACGKVVITTDRSGCRETVTDGVTGYIVKQQDADDLEEKVEQFLRLGREERIAMGKAAREKMEKEFDRNIIIDAYLKEIDSALE